MLSGFKYFMIPLLLSYIICPQNLLANHEQNNDSLLVSKYLLISRENEQENPVKSFLYLDKIETHSLKNNYIKGVLAAKKERAHIYYNQQKYDDALAELQGITSQALALDSIDLARFYNLKGSIFQAREEVDSSLYYLNQSLEVYKQINEAEGIITSLTNIGISLYQSNLTKEALQYFEDAYTLCTQLKYYKNLPVVMNNYAALLVRNGQSKKAEQLFLKMFESDDLDKKPSQKVTLLLNWASFKLETGQQKEAFNWYQKTLEYSIAKGITVSPKVYIGLGQVYLFDNKSERAVREFNKALDLNPVYLEKKMIYKGLASTYLKLNMQDSIAHYWQQLNTLIEEKHKEDTRRAIVKAQQTSEHYKKDVDIQLLKKDNHILVQKNRANNFIILSLALICILVLSAIYGYKKQQQQKNKQLQKEMTIKKQALVTYALKVTQKNQLLYKLKEKIEQPELTNIAQLSMLQKEITSAITHSIHNEKDWEEFERYFLDIYQGFYERLKENFPDLTDNDLRVCSLVKLRFTIKEISNLLFLSMETVKSTRYRIRKKMNLQQEQNLADFLNEI